MTKCIIFDLGGVLIDWNPEHLYRKIFQDEQEMKRFLQEVCTSDWNEEQDAGRTVEEATTELVKKYPEHEENIKAFYGRWSEMLGGAIEPAVEIFRQLKATDKYKIYALTNWSEQTFPVALGRFDFLEWFDGIVVSGTEKIRKPFAKFYQLLLDRYGVEANEAVFIDDNKRNVDAADKLGLKAIHFINAEQLRKKLEDLGLL